MKTLGLHDSQEEADNAVRAFMQRLGLSGDETECVVFFAAVAGDGDLKKGVNTWSRMVAGVPASCWERIPELPFDDPRLIGRLYTFTAYLLQAGKHWMTAPRRLVLDRVPGGGVGATSSLSHPPA